MITSTKWNDHCQNIFENSALQILNSDELTLQAYKKILVKLFYFHFGLETALVGSYFFEESFLYEKITFMSDSVKQDLAILGLTKDCFCESNILCYPVHRIPEESVGALLMRDQLCQWHPLIQNSGLKKLGLTKKYGASLFYRERLKKDFIKLVEKQIEKKQLKFDLIEDYGIVYFQRLFDLFNSKLT